MRATATGLFNCQRQSIALGDVDAADTPMLLTLTRAGTNGILSFDNSPAALLMSGKWLGERNWCCKAADRSSMPPLAHGLPATQSGAARIDLILDDPRQHRRWRPPAGERRDRITVGSKCVAVSH